MVKANNEGQRKAPILRFKGFTDDWKQRDLQSQVQFFSGLTYSPNDVKDAGTFVIRSSNIKNNMLVSADNVYVNPNAANSELVKKDDIIMVVRNGSKNLIGKHALVTREIDNSVIGAFMTGIRSSEPYFLNALLDTINFKKEIYKNLGATINQITVGNLRKMTFKVPNESEKLKIGNLFKKLNNLLALYERKVKLLTQIKKYLLDNLFAEKDYPNLRFKGFTDAWEQRELKEVAKIIGGGTPSTKFSEYWNGDVNWFTPNEITSQIYFSESKRKISSMGLQKSSAKLLPANKTILFTSRATIGEMGILTQDAATNQGFQSLVVNNENVPYFIFSMKSILRKQAIKKASGSIFLEISKKEVEKLKVTIPFKDEQKLIGKLFKVLNNLLALYEQNLSHLKELKKYLLQNMFC